MKEKTERGSNSVKDRYGSGCKIEIDRKGSKESNRQT